MTEIKVLSLDILTSMSLDEKIQAFKNGYHLEDTPLLESLSYRNIHGKNLHDNTTVDGGAALFSVSQIPIHGSAQHTGTIGDHQANLTGVGTYNHTNIDSHITAASAHGTSGNIVGTTDTQTLTNKTITDSTNNVMAKSLKSATTTIDISAANAPTVGQILTATGSSTAIWQTPTGGASPAISVISETSYSQSSAVGTSTNYARQDHTHGTPSDTPFEHIIYKNQPSGYSGLNSNTLLWPYQIYPSLEEYSNHFGTVDNFTQTVLAGNGTQSTDVLNHKMDLSTGITAASSATYDTKKTWTLGTNPIIVDIVVQGIQAGGSGSVSTQLGLSGVFGLYVYMLTAGDAAAFESDASGNWNAHTGKTGTGFTDTAITTPSPGDLLTIVATASTCKYYVNGVLVATHNTNIPTGALNIGGGVACGTGLTTARKVSVDLLSLKVYK